MPQDPEERPDSGEPSYRIYRSGSARSSDARSGSGRSGSARSSDARSGGGRSRSGRSGSPGGATHAGRARAEAGSGAASSERADRPYTTYRSSPRGLGARLRGESEADVGERRQLRETGESRRRGWLRGWTWRRALKWVVAIVVGWVVLSIVLFFISAEDHAGDLPAGASKALTSAGPMLFSPNTILILGLDNRPTSGPGSKEGGLQPSQQIEADANTDSIMLWRIGGGVSRRLSIPRDTLVNVPGYGEEKINAAWSQGGPALTIKVIRQLTGVTINHLIVVDLANFPKFIDDIGGVTVKTGRICSNISGGRKDGGFTLDLRPGVHHLNGQQALVLARTRDNSCNLAYDDLNREAAQQQILNGIKSQLFSVHAFLHLPWASWDAPGVIQTDMGGLSLMQLFISSEIGGSAPTSLLSETSSTYNSQDVLLPNTANIHRQVQKLLTGSP